jgi:hypothetical protein
MIARTSITNSTRRTAGAETCGSHTYPLLPRSPGRSISFDWNSSPLSIEAAHERRAKDKELREKLREEASAKGERAAQRRQHSADTVGFGDVRAACNRWLRSRGMITQTGLGKQDENSFTNQLRRILREAAAPMTIRQIADAIGNVQPLKLVRGHVCHLYTRGEIVTSGRKRPVAYSIAA